jgi:hypothetical protein
MTCSLCGCESTGYLCHACTEATVDRLAGMPHRYEELASFLHPGGRRPEFGRSRPSEAPLPLAEPVVSLRGPGGIVGVLEDWRSAMQAARGWGEPVISGSIARRVHVAARALWLNVEWVAEHWDMAGQLADEVWQLEREVLAIIDPEDPAERPKKLGPCPVLLDADAVCGAVLLLRPGQSAIQCSWCGASWPPARWLGLGEAQRALEETLSAA